MNKPTWFSDDSVVFSNAPTCGIYGKGFPLFKYNTETGEPLEVKDPETGEYAPEIDDQLSKDVDALISGSSTSSLRRIKKSELNSEVLVPTYYHQTISDVRTKLNSEFPGYEIRSLGDLIDGKFVTKNHGHGYPSKSVRFGDVPYIKVSDLRAGMVNINPTNMVTFEEAQGHWPSLDFGKLKDEDLRALLVDAGLENTGERDELLAKCKKIKPQSSGLKEYDLISPVRASSNIGQFCVLMPGQSQIVITKEVLVLRASKEALFDQFYLMWAMSLNSVYSQWKRVILMQTNREHVGELYREILIPIPKTKAKATEVSEPFRAYFKGLSATRTRFSEYLTKSNMHHFHLTSE